jgi:predicted MPP superfamily phosphohydrolase
MESIVAEGDTCVEVAYSYRHASLAEQGPFFLLKGTAMAWSGHFRPKAKHLAVRRFAGTRSFYEYGYDTLRIAHLTDQHVGRVTPDELQRAAIQAANDSSPDLVLLTGDYVAHSLDYLDQLREYLLSIQAPAYAVLGNHDHWSDAQEVLRILEQSGIIVLENQWTELTVGGRPLQLVGIDDPYTGHDDVEQATKGLDANIPTIALSHVGEAADGLWANSANLVLSGHTHSGQFTVGKFQNFALGTLGQHRYIHGLYGCRAEDIEPGALYVSAGIGSSRISARFGDRAQPEVAIFDLHQEPGSFDEHHDVQSAHR